MTGGFLSLRWAAARGRSAYVSGVRVASAAAAAATTLSLVEEGTEEGVLLIDRHLRLGWHCVLVGAGRGRLEGDGHSAVKRSDTSPALRTRLLSCNYTNFIITLPYSTSITNGRHDVSTHIARGCPVASYSGRFSWTAVSRGPSHLSNSVPVNGVPYSACMDTPRHLLRHCRDFLFLQNNSIHINNTELFNK